MAGESVGMPDVMGGVMKGRAMGKSNAPDQHRAQQRGHGGRGQGLRPAGYRGSGRAGRQNRVVLHVRAS